MRQPYKKKNIPKIFDNAIIFLAFITFSTSCNKPDFRSVRDAKAANNLNQATDKPNIIIILADDVGYDALSSHGNQTFQTPRLDEMRSNGMDFTHCYGSPLCSPSRFMFVTGQYNFRNYTVWGEMNPNQKTFANLMQAAGYATYVAGKWQFDGGDTAIRNFGYDDYSVWDPDKDLPAGSHYKDPHVYEKGRFLSASKIKDKYGDDIFTTRVLSFIKSNQDNKFFVFFPITLCHAPYSPTPDNPEFTNWPANGNDTTFFPSMIKYMDKKVGQIIDSLKAWNLYDNTIVMFSGDNGTPQHIWYSVNEVLKEGTKASTTAAGTNVPLIVTWPTKIAGGQINRNLVDFTDFLPTVADAAQISIPNEYGVIDGVSFYNQLDGTSDASRSWVFCHYDPNTNKGSTVRKRWIQDTTYKAYDSTKKLFDIVKDPEEKSPIRYADMTLTQKAIYKNFQSIMDTLR